MKERWVEHFSELFNSPPPINHLAVREPIDHVAGEEDPPSREEVRSAIREMKNHKAPGFDMLPAELYKAGGDSLVNELV